MIQLSTDLSDPLLELIQENDAPVDALEVGAWFSVEQVRAYRQRLPQLPFHFHGGDLIEGVGLIPGRVARITAYLECTGSPWASMHITMWLPGMVWLIRRRRWRIPLPNPGRATRRFIGRVKMLARSIRAPVTLENNDPQPLDGYEFEAQSGRIRQVIEETGCGLLLDTGHARVAAARLGVDVHDYLNELPLERTVQVHLSGPRERNGRLVDAHEPLQEIDYALLDFVLERTQPRVVTLEYIREREALREQLQRLRRIVDDHNQVKEA